MVRKEMGCFLLPSFILLSAYFYFLLSAYFFFLLYDFFLRLSPFRFLLSPFCFLTSDFFFLLSFLFLLLSFFLLEGVEWYDKGYFFGFYQGVVSVTKWVYFPRISSNCFPVWRQAAEAVLLRYNALVLLFCMASKQCGIQGILFQKMKKTEMGKKK